MLHAFNFEKYEYWQTCSTRVRTKDSSPDLNPFLLEQLDFDLDLNRKDLDLDLRLLDLDSDLGRFVTKSNFSFHCAHLQCFVYAV